MSNFAASWHFFWMICRQFFAHGQHENRQRRLEDIYALIKASVNAVRRGMFQPEVKLIQPHVGQPLKFIRRHLIELVGRERFS